MSGASSYRRDIDGLRAVAVLSVVLYHLGVGAVSGGFVGVDVFFVISGFLITGILYREFKEGAFSYGSFYERRIRRLLPALAVMLLVTAIPAWLLLLPEDYKLFTEAQALSVIFLANIHFWNKTDYFNDTVENIPLLHTWSLAVEEQFYLLFPPILLLLLRFVPARVGLALAGLALLSLLGTEHALSRSPESAFYLVHLRAWELLAGSLLATGCIPALRRQWLREWLALAGLALVLASVFILDKQSRFPGVTALPAVLGSVMIIHSGKGAGTRVSRLLSLRLMVFIGLISYSLYLWHWPLFVFASYYLIEPFSATQQVALLFIACLIGWLSWRFVEQPFRQPVGVLSRRRFFRNAGAVALLLIVVALPGAVTDGAPKRMPDEVLALDDVSEERIPFRSPCFGLTPQEVDSEQVCSLGANHAVEFLLWGDSHALALAHGVDLAGKAEGVGGAFVGRSACPPVLGSREFRASNTSCRDFNTSVTEYLARHPNIRHVLLVAYWSHYQPSLSSDAREQRDSFASGLERTLELLKEKEVRVTIVDQVPSAQRHVPSIMARSLYFGRDLDMRVPLKNHQQQMKPFRELLSQLRGNHNFEVVSLDSLFCGESLCEVQAGGYPYYRDDHHLSRLGAEQAVEFLQPLLRAESSATWGAVR